MKVYEPASFATIVWIVACFIRLSECRKKVPRAVVTEKYEGAELSVETPKFSKKYALMAGEDWWSLQGWVTIPKSQLTNWEMELSFDSLDKDVPGSVFDKVLCTVNLTSCAPRPDTDTDICFCSAKEETGEKVKHTFFVKNKIVKFGQGDRKVNATIKKKTSSHKLTKEVFTMNTILKRVDLKIYPKEGFFSYKVTVNPQSLFYGRDEPMMSVDTGYSIYAKPKQDIYVYKSKVTVLWFCVKGSATLELKKDEKDVEAKNVIDKIKSPDLSSSDSIWSYSRCWTLNTTFKMSKPTILLKMAVKEKATVNENKKTSQFEISIKGHPCSIADPCNSHWCSPVDVDLPNVTCSCYYDRDGKLTMDIARWHKGILCQEAHPCAAGHDAACGEGSTCNRNVSNLNDKMCFTFNDGSGGSAVQGSLMALVAAVMAAGGWRAARV